MPRGLAPVSEARVRVTPRLGTPIPLGVEPGSPGETSRHVWLVLVGVALSAIVGIAASAGRLDLRTLLILAVAVVGIATVLAGSLGIRILFLVWVLGFAAGIRGVHVAPQLTIYFTTGLALALAFLLVVRLIVIERTPLRPPFTKPLWAFSIFWLWGWVPAIGAWDRFGAMVNEFLGLTMILPIFLIAGYVLRDRRWWYPTLLCLYLSTVVIAALGVLDWHVPALSNLLNAGAQQSDYRLAGAEGFDRATFRFFGSAAVTVICAVAFPLLFPLWSRFRGRLARALIASSGLLVVYATYLSGTREAWYSTVLSAVLYLCSQRRWGAVAGLGLAGVVAWPLLPRETASRVFSILSFAEGSTTDTSLAKRWQRSWDALQTALRSPEGIGWAGAGWVHSDFLQTAANLGLLAGIVFVAAYGWSLLNAYQTWLASKDEIQLALLISFVTVGLILASEGVQVEPYFGYPVWLIWALLEVRGNELRSRRSERTDRRATCASP